MKKGLLFLGFILAAVFAFVFGVADNATTLVTAIMPAALLDDANYRVFYNAVKKISLQAGCIAAPADLRSEVALVAGQSTYNFKTLQQSIDGTLSTLPLQKGVKNNDLIIAYKVGLFLYNKTGSSNSVQLQTYVNPIAFTSTNTETVDDLEVFYNGFLNYSVGSTIFFDQLSTMRFKTVPFAQQSSSTDRSEFDLSWAAKDVAARPIFSGKADNDVQLTLIPNTSFNPAGKSGYTNIACFWAYGLVIKNGANKEGLYDALVAASGSMIS